MNLERVAASVGTSLACRSLIGRGVLEGAGDLVRVPKGLLKGIYRLPQRDLWGLGFRVYLKGQGT